MSNPSPQVTEAMIEAGISACQQIRDAMAEGEQLDLIEGEVLRDIYLAMANARDGTE